MCTHFFVKDDTTKSSSAANELGLANVGGVFVVLMGGMGVACVIAVCEFVWKSRKVAVEETVSSNLTWPLTPDLVDNPRVWWNWPDENLKPNTFLSPSGLSLSLIPLIIPVLIVHKERHCTVELPPFKHNKRKVDDYKCIRRDFELKSK